MTEKSLSSLMPSEADIRAMLSQIAREDIGKLPVAMLQIGVARLVLKFVNRLKSELDTSIKKLEDEISR